MAITRSIIDAVEPSIGLKVRRQEEDSRAPLLRLGRQWSLSINAACQAVSKEFNFAWARLPPSVYGDLLHHAACAIEML